MAKRSPGKALREAVTQGTVRIPGAPNALAGRLVERFGFEAVYVSGAALSAGTLALPDVGLITLTELAQQTAYLTQTVEIPVVVDADTGFGNAVNVERTVVALQHAGAAAIQLEDQRLPKRCGHLSGKELVEPETMCAKLRAAVEARSDDDLVIVARTDARGVEGMDAAIARSLRYLEAGADWVFPEALESEEEFAVFAQQVDAPLVANMTEFGRSPLLNHQQLSEMGYAAVLYPVTLLRVAMKAMETMLAVVSTDGTQREFLDLMLTRDELYDYLDYEDFDERDRRYFQGES